MENLVSANEFCINHQIEISFITSLQEFGLIEIITIKDTLYVDSNELNKLERLLRLRYEMDINMEGIEAIVNLLQKHETMQTEIIRLKNRLSLYENDAEI
ncbi:chaperone modulator CbpM [soil metagenome]